MTPIFLIISFKSNFKKSKEPSIKVVYIDFIVLYTAYTKTGNVHQPNKAAIKNETTTKSTSSLWLFLLHICRQLPKKYIKVAAIIDSISNTTNIKIIISSPSLKAKFYLLIPSFSNYQEILNTINCIMNSFCIKSYIDIIWSFH